MNNVSVTSYVDLSNSLESISQNIAFAISNGIWINWKSFDDKINENCFVRVYTLSVLTIKYEYHLRGGREWIYWRIRM